MEMLPKDDHDLLIGIAEGQRELQSDVKAMSDALRDLTKRYDDMNLLQRDQASELIHVKNVLQRAMADQADDRRKLGTLETEHGRWKLYLKVALVMLTPIYIIIMALAVEAAKNWLFP